MTLDRSLCPTCATRRAEPENLLICERSADFFVAGAMGTVQVQLPGGTVSLSVEPLDQDALLLPNNAVCLLRG